MSAWRVLTLAGLTSKWFWLAMWITHCLGLLVLPPYSARRKGWQATKYQHLMLHSAISRIYWPEPLNANGDTLPANTFAIWMTIPVQALQEAPCLQLWLR